MEKKFSKYPKQQKYNHNNNHYSNVNNQYNDHYFEYENQYTNSNSSASSSPSSSTFNYKSPLASSSTNNYNNNNKLYYNNNLSQNFNYYSYNNNYNNNSNNYKYKNNQYRNNRYKNKQHSSTSSSSSSSTSSYYNNNSNYSNFNSNNQSNRNFYYKKNYKRKHAKRSDQVITNYSSPQVDYSKLPNVVLTKIYSYLSFKDRLNASLVCKNWRLGLFDPSLWHNSNLTIYLLNRFIDLKSSQFKSINLAKYAKRLDLKYDPNNLSLFANLLNILTNLNSQNLRCLTLQPILVNLYDDEFYDDETKSNQENNPMYSTNYIDDDYYNFYSKLTDKNNNENCMSRLCLNQNRKLFGELKRICTLTKSVEHLSLGLIDDLDVSKSNLISLLECLIKKHLFNLKSLHISTSKNMSSLTLISSTSFSSFNNTNKNNNNQFENVNNDQSPIIDRIYLSNYLLQFVNLTQLSIDYEHLSDEFLHSTVCLLSLKKLNLNVNSINNTISLENRIKDDSWSMATNRNKSLRVTVNFLVVEELAKKYNYVLSPQIPLEAISETLQSLVIVDAITDPTLRYHNPLRHDADPDPLVLLCWKCKYLKELVLVGYEMLEINLIAIAKLRTNLKTFYVPMDCIIDLRYGKFKNDDFIEDEDGEDTIVDYGFCSDQVIKKVADIIGCPNWHPLERDELPLCVYDYDLPYEEAYLETIINDQLYN